jgi:hypothetical protein
MVTKYKLYDGRRVAVEQTTTAILAHFEGEQPRHITSTDYMRIVMAGVPC